MRVQMNYAVYTPPGFTPDEELPLVVFLHGGGDDYQSFDRWEIGQRLDRAIEEGRVPRVVVTLPDGHMGMWANWADGSRRYQDWVMDEVIPSVERDYHTRSCPDDCHIMGVSMGGNGSLRMMLRYPERFASLAILSGPIFTTDEMIDFSTNGGMMRFFIPVRRIFGEPVRSLVEREDPFLVWRSREDYGDKGLFVAYAADDRNGIPEASRRFHEHLDEAGILHEFEEFEGGHNWVSWGPVIERAIAHNVGMPAEN